MWLEKEKNQVDGRSTTKVSPEKTYKWQWISEMFLDPSIAKIAYFRGFFKREKAFIMIKFTIPPYLFKKNFM